MKTKDLEAIEAFIRDIENILSHYKQLLEDWKSEEEPEDEALEDPQSYELPFDEEFL